MINRSEADALIPTPGEPQQPGMGEIFAVADWSPSLSFYTLDGDQVGRDTVLQFDPMTMDFFSHGDYLVLGGSARSLCLFTRDGVKLGTVCDAQESWIWCCKTRPDSQSVASILTKLGNV